MKCQHCGGAIVIDRCINCGRDPDNKPMMLKDYYVTITQAAKKVGVARQTIARWITVERIPYQRIGREVLIKKDALENMKCPICGGKRVIGV